MAMGVLGAVVCYLAQRDFIVFFSGTFYYVPVSLTAFSSCFWTTAELLDAAVIYSC